jgi:hypothetical protein
MRLALRSFALLLLLIVAQQGAVVHEVSHFSDASKTEAAKSPAGAAEAACALCPAFAQAVTPAFSHSFRIPHLVRSSPQSRATPLFRALDAKVPTPRSRGPPSQA